MPKKTLKFGLCFIMAVVLLFAVGQILVPHLGSWYIRREVVKQCPECGRIQASVQAFPFFKLFSMDYDNLEVQADRIAVEGIIFDTVTLKSDSWPDASYEAWVTDKEMYGVFSVSTSYLSQPALKLEGGYLIASGTINVGYSAVTVNIRGSLVPRDGRRIFLLPAEVEVTSPYNSSAIEDEVIDTVNSKPLFDMQENLPFKVSEIHITTGRLRFNGSMNIEHALKQM